MQHCLCERIKASARCFHDAVKHGLLNNKHSHYWLIVLLFACWRVSCSSWIKAGHRRTGWFQGCCWQQSWPLAQAVQHCPLLPSKFPSWCSTNQAVQRVRPFSTDNGFKIETVISRESLNMRTAVYWRLLSLQGAQNPFSFSTVVFCHQVLALTVEVEKAEAHVITLLC